MVNHPVWVPNNGPDNDPIQTQSVRSESWALPTDCHLNWEPVRPPHNPGTIPVSIIAILCLHLVIFEFKSEMMFPTRSPYTETEVSAVFGTGAPALRGVSPDILIVSLESLSGRVTRIASQLRVGPLITSPTHREPPPSEARSYNRAGKEPAAEFGSDVVKLQGSCERCRGTLFAVDWILVVFKHGVAKEGAASYY